FQRDSNINCAILFTSYTDRHFRPQAADALCRFYPEALFLAHHRRKARGALARETRSLVRWKTRNQIRRADFRAGAGLIASDEQQNRSRGRPYLRGGVVDRRRRRWLGRKSRSDPT